MKALAEQIGDIDGVEIFGRVVAVHALMVEVAGPIHAMSVGARLTIEMGGKPIPCEVVGFSGGHALAMPFAALDGVRRGCGAVVSSAAGAIRPSERWLGRVVNARAEPAPERSRALSPVFSACLWMATITMNPSPMRSVVSSMVTSSWSARSPSAVATRPSTF